jgi:predicted permease
VALDVSPDLRVLAFTAVVAVATAMLFSLAPAWRAAGVDPQLAMKAQGPGVVGGHSRFRAGKMLVAAQVALSLMLVAGAALLLGSFRTLAALDPGFHSANVLVVRADLRLPPGENARGPTFVRQILERLRALPGVQQAASAYTTPVSNNTWNGRIHVDGRRATSFATDPVYFNRVTSGYFSTLSMPLVAGRDLSDRDGTTATLVAVVNETLARRFFAGRNPVGETFRVPDGDRRGDPIVIVGVVRDAKYESLREDVPATAFFAMHQDSTLWPQVSFVVRSAGPPRDIASAVTRTFGDVAPRATLQLTTLDRQVAESLTRDRLMATLSAFFGVLALLLAMIGLYGTMSYNVARRRSEIGIRIALGAVPSRVLRVVLGDVGQIVGIGLVLGGLGTLASTRLVAGFLYGLTPRDPATLVGSAVLLGAVAALAGYFPARRASRMNPMTTLREE